LRQITEKNIEKNEKYNLIIKKAGFEAFLPFQKKLIEAFPGNKYIVAETKEGCGKTLGIALSVIENTDPSSPGLKSIVIASSHENAEKISILFKKLSQRKATTLRAIAANPDRNIKKDSRLLGKQPDIFISTADSIIDQIRSNNISLDSIQSCILEDSDVDDFHSFEKDIEFIFSKLTGTRSSSKKQFFMVFTKEKEHNYSFYQFFKKPITIDCTETGEEKNMDNSFIQNIVSKIKEAPDINSLAEVKKLIKKNVPFFTRGYFSAWLLIKYAEQNGYNIQASENEKEDKDFKTIFINVGKTKRLFAKDIAGIILSSKAAEESDLKRIKVFDSYSFIDVTTSKAEAILNTINGFTFKGKKLGADYAKKQQKSASAREK